MSRLNKIASKSDLMNIDISFNGQRYRFNLFEELQVSEASINKEIKSQASSYAFLTQLLVHLEKLSKELEMEQKAAWAKSYSVHKGTKGDSGRPLTDDLAKALADKSSSYLKAHRAWLNALFQKGVIQKAVISFEQRKDLIQSLSANLRNENK
jgi:hypothetical protein